MTTSTTREMPQFAVVIDATSTRTIAALRLAVRYLANDAAILDDADPALDDAIDELSGIIRDLETAGWGR